MDCLQSFDEQKEILPEFDDIRSTAGWRFSAEVLLERALIRIFKQDIEVISMNVATIEFDDALSMSDISKAIYFLLVLGFKFLGIRFQDKSAARGSSLV